MVSDAAGTPVTPPPDWRALLGEEAWDEAVKRSLIAFRTEGLEKTSWAGTDVGESDAALVRALDYLVESGVLHIEYRTMEKDCPEERTEQRLLSEWTEVPR